LAFFSKKVGVSNAAGVQGVELNASVVVVAAVQLGNGHHVAHLKESAAQRKHNNIAESSYHARNDLMLRSLF
jgi:hypothetical protein